MTTSNRPVFLNLLQFRFPIGAIMSIGHRASGTLLALAIPFGIYLLDLSLKGQDGFARATEILGSGIVRFLLFFLLWGLIHHLLAGIRFLLIDFDIGVDKESASKSATLVMAGAPVIALILGYLL